MPHQAGSKEVVRSTVDFFGLDVRDFFLGISLAEAGVVVGCVDSIFFRLTVPFLGVLLIDVGVSVVGVLLIFCFVFLGGYFLVVVDASVDFGSLPLIGVDVFADTPSS